MSCILRPLFTAPSARLCTELTEASLAHREPMTADEQRAIDTLIAYVAMTQKRAPSHVEKLFLSRFGINRIPDLSAEHFESAVRFLTYCRFDNVVTFKQGSRS